MPDLRLFGDERVRQYEATGGKVGHHWNGASVLILHVLGRASGRTRKCPLIYGRDGDDYLIVALEGRRTGSPWLVQEPACSSQRDDSGLERPHPRLGTHSVPGREEAPVADHDCELAGVRQVPAED